MDGGIRFPRIIIHGTRFITYDDDDYDDADDGYAHRRGGRLD